MSQYMNEYRKRTTPIKRQRALDYLGGKCVECETVENLHFHHLDPSTKEYDVSTGAVHKGWQKLVIELDKCELRCEAHHIDEHRSSALCGTAQRYWRGCRCQPCTTANTEHNKEYKARRFSSIRRAPIL